MKLKIKSATTSLIQMIFINDSSSTTGAGLTGLTNASAGLVCYYKADNGSASVSSTLVTITTLGTYAGTSTNTGFKEVDATNMPGLYELHVANNAFASGIKRVVVMLKGATNMVPVVLEIELDAVDYQDAVHFGLSCLPNTAVTTNASLLTSGTGTDQLSVAAGLVSLVATQNAVLNTGTATAGAASTITLAASASATASIYNGSVIRIISGTGAGQSRVITAYTTGKVATVNANWLTNPDATSVYSVIGDYLPFVNSSGQVPVQPGTGTGQISLSSGLVSLVAAQNPSVGNGTAQAGAASSITLAAGASATDSIYNGSMVTITSGTGAGQTRIITAYVGSTKVATVNATWQTNPDATSVYTIYGEYLPVVNSSGYVGIQTGTGTGQLDFTSGVVKSNVTQLLGTAWLTPGTAGTPDVNVVKFGGTTVTGRDIGASVLLSSGTGTGQISLSSGLVSLVASQNPIIRTGTAQAGAASTITLDAGASGVSNYYRNAIVYIYGGTGAGQIRSITAYNTSQVATVNTAWSTIPDATSLFMILPCIPLSVDTNFAIKVQPGTGTGQIDLTAGVAKVNVTQLLGTAWLTPTVAGTPDVNTLQFGGTTVTGRDIGASVLLSSGTGTGQISLSSGLVSLIAAQNPSVLNGTASAGTSSTITLTGGVATDSYYNGSIVIITSGTGVGQTRTILSYVGSTKVATVDRAWTTAPDNTSVFTVFADPHAQLDSNLRTQIQVGTSAGQINLNNGNVPIDLTQAVPTSNTNHTIGDALNAARAQGFGKWVLSGTTLTLYAADGTTAVHSFTLNSPTSPTSRT